MKERGQKLIRYHCIFRPYHSMDYATTALNSGIDGFEIANLRSYTETEDFEQYLSRALELRDVYGATLTVHSPILDINLGSINKAICQVAVNEIKDSADLAMKLGSKVVVVHPVMGVLTMPP